MRIVPPFVFATGNVDKARELMEQLTLATAVAFVAEPIDFNETTYGYLVATVGQRPSIVAPQLEAVPDVAETGSTLQDNARIKAEGMCAATGLTAIADDTGLHVDALAGRPGVFSARFAGPDATYVENVELLLSELAKSGAKEPSSRTARFVTAIHVATCGTAGQTVFGAVEGTIANVAIGDGTFGYDPVFVPSEGDGRTFAQMTSREKHALSHRGRAFRSLLEICSIDVELPNER